MAMRLAFRSKTTAVLLKALPENPDITIEVLAQKAGITSASVKKQLQQLAKKGYIQRMGKDGSWYVLASPSTGKDVKTGFKGSHRQPLKLDLTFRNAIKQGKRLA